MQRESFEHLVLPHHHKAHLEGTKTSKFKKMKKWYEIVMNQERFSIFQHKPTAQNQYTSFPSSFIQLGLLFLFLELCMIGPWCSLLFSCFCVLLQLMLLRKVQWQRLWRWLFKFTQGNYRSKREIALATLKIQM